MPTPAQTENPRTVYRLQYLDHLPGQYGPTYGDCWRAVMPDRAYTRLETALRRLCEHAAALDAPAFRGITRIVAYEGEPVQFRVVASRRDGTPLSDAINPAARGETP